MHLDHPKQYHLLAGVPILVHTVRAFINHGSINRIVVVVPADFIEQTNTLFTRYQLNSSNLTIIAGGRRRQVAAVELVLVSSTVCSWKSARAGNCGSRVC